MATTRKLTPREIIVEAERTAVSRIADAQREAEARLASAARDAHHVVTSAAGERGEQWDDYRKLVMSELASLKVDLKVGFEKISVQFSTHDSNDAVIFARIDKDINDLSTKVATLAERTSSQLWVVWGAAIGSGLALLLQWVK